MAMGAQIAELCSKLTSAIPVWARIGKRQHLIEKHFININPSLWRNILLFHAGKTAKQGSLSIQ